METNKDELLARIKSADPAKTLGLPKVELPKRKPSLRVRPLYFAPVAAAGAIALVLSIGNTSPLIVANADQLSEYQQAMENYGFLDETDYRDAAPSSLTPDDTPVGGPIDQNEPDADPVAQNGSNVEVVIHPRAQDFIKPGEIYRAKIAADFDARFKIYQGIFGAGVKKFTYGKVGGFTLDNQSSNKNLECSGYVLYDTPAQPSTLEVIKRYAKGMNIPASEVVYDYWDYYCDTLQGQTFNGSLIEIYEVINGGLRAQGVVVTTDALGNVDTAGGLISDYEVMDKQQVIPMETVFKTSTETVSPYKENFVGSGLRPITSGGSSRTVAVVPMYLTVYTTNGEEWYVPSYYFIYWNGQIDHELAVKTDPVKWIY